MSLHPQVRGVRDAGVGAKALGARSTLKEGKVVQTLKQGIQLACVSLQVCLVLNVPRASLNACLTAWDLQISTAMSFCMQIHGHVPVQILVVSRTSEIPIVHVLAQIHALIPVHSHVLVQAFPKCFAGKSTSYIRELSAYAAMSFHEEVFGPLMSEAGLSSCRSMPPLELASSVSSSTVSTASATPQVTAAAGNHTASSTPTRPTACVLASLQNSRGRTSPGAAPTTTAGAALAPAAARQAAVPAPPAAAATDIAATSSSAATNAAMPGLQQQQQQQQQRVKPSGGLMSSLDLRIRQAAAAILSHTIQQPPQQQQQLEEEQAEDRRQQWQQQQPVNEEVQTGL
eukprot:scaffold78502_cov21-Tisochrysis_lutea.AAC.5